MEMHPRKSVRGIDLEDACEPSALYTKGPRLVRALAFACFGLVRVRLFPADVHEHCTDLADSDRDLETDLADRLRLARGRAVVPQLGE
jgi:hypothetical protein